MIFGEHPSMSQCKYICAECARSVFEFVFVFVCVCVAGGCVV